MKRIIVASSLIGSLMMASVAGADITIGVTLSETGPAASLGIAEKNAIMLGPKVIAGQKVNYVIYDESTDATKAVQNVKRLISENKADVLIGPGSGHTALAVVPFVNEAKIPMIQLAPAPSATAAGNMDKRKWIFSAPPTDDLYAETATNFMVKKRIKTLSIISVDDGFGETTVAAFKKFAQQAGLKILTIEKFKRSDTSATSQALRAMQGNPDMIYIVAPGTPAALPHLALVDRGYKGTIFHSGASVNADFLRVGGKALEGSYNLALSFVVADQMPEGFPGRKESQEFVKLYESKYGPASQFAALAWNSVKIIEAAIPKALKTAKPGTEKFREALRDAIEQTKGLKAAGAVINMSPTDHTGISRDSMTVIRVENGKWKLEDHSSH